MPHQDKSSGPGFSVHLSKLVSRLLVARGEKSLEDRARQLCLCLKKIILARQHFMCSIGIIHYPDAVIAAFYVLSFLLRFLVNGLDNLTMSK